MLQMVLKLTGKKTCFNPRPTVRSGDAPPLHFFVCNVKFQQFARTLRVRQRYRVLLVVM